MKHTPPTTVKLDDVKAEQVARDHREKITALQSAVFAGAEYVTASLPSGVDTQVPHKLGKKPVLVIESVIRGAVSAGILVEKSRDDRYVTLNASGFGATIALELVVA